MRLQSFLLGIATGAGIGILIAPASGKKLRQKLTRGAKEVKDTVQNFVPRIKEGFAEEVAKVTEDLEVLKNPPGEYVYRTK
jgi:gas vesicle protein